MRPRLLLLLLTAALALLAATAGPAAAATSTQHARLGLTTSFAFNEELDCFDDPSDPGNYCIEGIFGEDLAGYFFGLSGSANVSIDLGADLTLTYDRNDLVPGGSVPVTLTYTPTNDPGPEVSIGSSATLTAQVDITTAGFIELCSLLPPICPVLAILDTINEQVNVTIAEDTLDFTAPLAAGDPSGVLSGASTPVVLSFAGLDLIEAQLESSLTLSADPPVPGAAFPGLGGAAAAIAVTGGDLTSLTNPVNPSLIVPIGPADVAVLEWSAGGQAIPATIQLPNTPGGVTATLSPVMHWLGTSADVRLDLDLVGALGDIFGDPADIQIFNGNLGPLFQSQGIDTALAAAVTAAIGFDPGIATQVGLGNLPIPALNPQPPGGLPAIPPIPGASTFTFSIDSDADDDGLFDGTELTGCNPTDPDDPDSDNDGLTDGEEDANKNGCVDAGETNPNDPDSDGDGVLDGPEVEGCNPTNPLDPDSDDDGLTDGQEDVNGNGCQDPGETNPNDPDSDDDGLNDGIEVQVGTDPLDPDSDNDGIPDGQDVDWLQGLIDDLPPSAFKGNGHPTAINAHLDNIERRIADGKVGQALNELAQLRSKLDGCGTAADNTDWIVDCTAQTEIRGFVDLIVDNLTP
jgi:hypothetical protein